MNSFSRQTFFHHLQIKLYIVFILLTDTISFKMHISKSFITAAIAVATPSLVAAQLNPEYTLHVNSSTLSVTPQLQTGFVSYANSQYKFLPNTPLRSPKLTPSGSIWIGNINRQIYAEPFSVRGEFTFTSYHAVATGEQQLYIFPTETQPIMFTVPRTWHS